MTELLKDLAVSKSFFASPNEVYDNNLLLSFQACSSRCESSTWFRAYLELTASLWIAITLGIKA